MSRSPVTSRSGLPRKLLTYAGGSVVATVCSEVTLLVLYGLLRVPPGWASVFAWAAGAVPNYWLNRSWTWQRRGRPDLRREVLPYVVVIGLTLLLAALTTGAVDAGLRSAGTASGTRVVLVATAFLGVYVVMFVVRFALLDRLFGRLAVEPGDTGGKPRHEPATGTRG